MMNRQTDNRNTAFFFALVFPLAGLIMSLQNWRKKWAKNVFWLVCVFLGSIFIYWPEGTDLGLGADAGRYALDLIRFYNNRPGFLGVLYEYRSIYGSLDLYQAVVTFIISSFTDNGHVLFTVFAIVFGYFYSRNVWYVLERLPEKRFGPLVILVALYFLVCPITQINGARMWTALHVYVFGMMPYLLEKDRSKFWGLILAPFFHFSFFYISLFGLAYLFLPNLFKARSSTVQIVALSVFITTLLVNSLNLESVSEILAEFSPASYEERIGLYVNQDAMDNRLEQSVLVNWYLPVSEKIQGWCYNILLVILLPCLRKRFRNDERLLNLYVFTLFISGIGNLMAMVPSGGRFQILALMFKIPLVILVAMSVPKSDWFYKTVSIALLFLLLPLVVEFRKLFDFFSITLLLDNFITTFIWENNTPLIEWVKMVL